MVEKSAQEMEQQFCKLLDEYLAEQDATRTGAGTQPLREGET